MPEGSKERYSTDLGLQVFDLFMIFSIILCGLLSEGPGELYNRGKMPCPIACFKKLYGPSKLLTVIWSLRYLEPLGPCWYPRSAIHARFATCLRLRAVGPWGRRPSVQPMGQWGPHDTPSRVTPPSPCLSLSLSLSLSLPINVYIYIYIHTHIYQYTHVNEFIY